MRPTRIRDNKMKRIFFKVGLFLALGLTTTAFYSCNNDDDNSGISDNGGNGGNGSNSGNASTITATDVINGSAQITTVKAIAHWESGGEWSYETIAQTPYENNGFTLKFPETLADKYLVSIGEFIGSDYMTEVFISDKNAKTYFFDADDIYGYYDEDENEMGKFYLREDNDNGYYDTSWMYADRDVAVKGEGEWSNGTDKYDLNLKKGWNVVYKSQIGSYNNSTGVYVSTYTLTSQKPAGVNYSWSFYNFNSTGTAAKSVENKKSVFSKLQEDRKNGIRQRQEK